MLQVQIKRGPCFDLDLKIEFKISTYPIYIQHVQYGAYMTEGSKILVQIRTLHRFLCVTLNFNIKAWFKVTALHSLTWGQSFVESELDLTKERENMVQNLFKDQCYDIHHWPGNLVRVHNKHSLCEACVSQIGPKEEKIWFWQRFFK